MSKETDRPYVSIFYPCYNDWGTMGSMVLFTVQVAQRLGIDYDLTIVDDGSAPHTHDLLVEITAHFPDTRVVRHEKNRGYGRIPVWKEKIDAPPRF